MQHPIATEKSNCRLYGTYPYSWPIFDINGFNPIKIDFNFGTGRCDAMPAGRDDGYASHWRA
ncbi:MAG: hypothetical protein WBQ49_11660 [Rhodomicrobium sp.]